MNQYRNILFVFALLLLPLLACGPIEILSGTPTPEPTSTPQGDSIHFQVPLFRTSLAEGATVPGTLMTYVGRDNNAYQVRIDGLPAAKQSGDSFAWKGTMAPGVVGHYQLRLTTAVGGELIAAGPVSISVLNPFPLELPSNETPTGTLFFNEIVAGYYVPVGHAIPGTSLVYQGRSELGATLSGTTGYPHFQQGDSLRWTGQLRDNVFVRYNLRLITIADEGIRVAGTAELWVK
jgi:hypothetical protein